MVEKFEKRLGGKMNDYSASLAAMSVDIPVLVVHDKEDRDVPVSSGHSIRQNLRNGGTAHHNRTRASQDTRNPDGGESRH